MLVKFFDTSDENCCVREKYDIVLLTSCITDILGGKQSVNKVIRLIIFADLSPLCQPYLEFAQCVHFELLSFKNCS